MLQQMPPYKMRLKFFSKLGSAVAPGMLFSHSVHVVALYKAPGRPALRGLYKCHWVLVGELCCNGAPGRAPWDICTACSTLWFNPLHFVHLFACLLVGSIFLGFAV